MKVLVAFDRQDRQYRFSPCLYTDTVLSEIVLVFNKCHCDMQNTKSEVCGATWVRIK